MPDRRRKKRSIVYITTITLPQKGMASANRMLSISRGLVERGHEVQILTLRSDDGKKEVFEVDGVRCHSLTNGNENDSCIRKIFCLLQFIFKTTGFLFVNKKRIDCVIVYAYFIPLLFSVYASTRLARIPSIREECEYPSCLTGSARNKTGFMQQLRGFIELRVEPRLYDGMIVMTRTLITFLMPRVRRNCVLAHVPMTVDMNRFSYSVTESMFEFDYIAYCGDMSNNKDGVEDLINAFSLISEEYSELRLVLVGKAVESDMKRLKKIAKQSPSGDKILFTGMIARHEIPGLLKNAKILAVTRPENLQAAGGFPTKLGEYLSTAQPVVVTKVGEIPDYLENHENAYLAEPDNPASVASCFREVLDNYDQALLVGRRGQEVAQRAFNYHVQAGLVEDLICRVCNE